MDNSYQNTRDFISKHRKDNVKLLALQYSKNSHIDINEAITQIAGWQIAEKKNSIVVKFGKYIIPQASVNGAMLFRDYS